MSAAKSTPTLDIPSSESTVSVSIIDTTTRIIGNGIPASGFMQPEIPGFSTLLGGCSYAFLIKRHSSATKSKHDTLLFDLGTRKDIENSPKVLIEQMKAFGFGFGVEKSVFDILKDAGDDPGSVGGIIWSHYHPDHTGDPSLFPTSTDLIVGPSFKQNFVPGWPTKEDSQVDEKAWDGRDLIEIDFDGDRALTLGDYRALDFYGDGSLYLIDCPGHAHGHMCALARTSSNPPEFVLMGGDVAHHGGEFRPTEYVPLTENIVPNPLVPPFAKATSICPGALFTAIHPKNSSTEPFMQPTGFLHDDVEKACESLEKLLIFDAQDDILTMIAHDKTLADVVDFYPNTVNGWKEKGWKEQLHWRFLRDFETGSEEHKPA